MAIQAKNSDFLVKNGLVVATTATIQSTQNSTSPSTGALIVAGGAGIAGDLYASNIYSNGYALTTATTWANITNINNINGPQKIAIGQDSGQTTSQIAGQLKNVLWANGQYVSVGQDNNSSVIFFTSSDGISWDQQAIGQYSTGFIQNIIWDGTQYVVLASSGQATVFTSPDGVTWSSTDVPGSYWVHSIAFNGTDTYVLAGTNIGFNKATFWTSPDLTTWTQQEVDVFSVEYPGIYSVTWGNGQFIAVGAHGASSILTSPDGVTWTQQTAPTTVNLRSVIWSGTQFVAVGDYSYPRVITSPDGVVWTEQSVPTYDGGTYFNTVAYNGVDQYVAVGAQSDGWGNYQSYKASIFTSPDGVTWTQQHSITQGLFGSDGITYGNGQYVLVGNIGHLTYGGASVAVVYTSPDGINWTEQIATPQGNWAVAIGAGAGAGLQSQGAIAIGYQAGEINQGGEPGTAIAIGWQAGQHVQGGNSVAIGTQAGQNNQGENSIAIGYYTNASTGSIVISATGNGLYAGTAGLFIDPIRNDNTNTTNVLYYNGSEITWGPTNAFNGGTVAGAVHITDVTQSSDITTGALIVDGGVGVGGNLYVGGTFSATNITMNGVAVSTATAFIGGTITEPLYVNNSTSSSSTTTGAVTVVGGVGIQGDLFVGGTVTATNVSVINNITANNSLTLTGSRNGTGLYVTSSTTVYYSLQFGGSTDYLYNSTANVLDVGTNDFTVEFWMYPTRSTTETIIASYSTPGLDITLRSGAWTFDTKSGTEYTGGSYSTNTWTHVAITRSAGEVRTFTNGVLGNTHAISDNYSSAGFVIGALNTTPTQVFAGYLSDIRVIKNVAVYLATFTPTTTPLTASASTSLLTADQSTIIDSSINNINIIKSGNPAVVTNTPYILHANSGISWTYDGTNAWQTGGDVKIGGGLTVDGNLVLVDQPTIYDQAGVAVDTTTITLDSFDANVYRSAKYTVSISNKSTNQYQTSEIWLVQDGTNSYLEETSVFSNGGSLVAFTTTISSNNVLLRAGGYNDGNIIKVQRTYITV